MEHHKKYLTDTTFLVTLLTGLVAFLSSIIVNFYAGAYATRLASSSVTDLILSNTRVYDVDILFVWGAIALTVLIVGLCLWRINYMPFVAKSLSLFIIIRSMFISLTHISPYPFHVTISSAFFNNIYFTGIFTGDDLFFSGHTGIPFLMALLFWDNIVLRYLFIFLSLLFGTVVLLGHLHYSIDVLSAFFITYSIFHICLKFFPEDWELFNAQFSDVNTE